MNAGVSDDLREKMAEALFLTPMPTSSFLPFIKQPDLIRRGHFNKIDAALEVIELEGFRVERDTGGERHGQSE